MKLASKEGANLLAKFEATKVGATVEQLVLPSLLQAFDQPMVATMIESCPGKNWELQISWHGIPVCNVGAEIVKSELQLEVLA